MKIKKEYIVLFVVITFLSLYLALHRRGRVHYRLPRPGKIELKNVSSLAIEGKNSTIVLDKEEGVWRINPKNFRADETIVKELVQGVGSLEISSLASQSKDYSRYELGKEKGITVKLKKGKEIIRTVRLGKVAPSYRHTFVTIEDDPNIYRVRGNLRRLYNKTAGDIRDKNVLTVVEQIGEITLTKGKDSMTATLQQPSAVEDKSKENGSKTNPSPPFWETRGGKKLKTAEVNGIIDNVSHLKCEGFIEGKEKGDFSRPVFSVQLKGSREYSLSIYGKEKNRYPAISSMSDYPFYLPDWKVKQIMKDPDELVETDKQRKGKPMRKH